MGFFNKKKSTALKLCAKKTNWNKTAKEKSHWFSTITYS